MFLSQPPLWLILIAFVALLGPLVTIHELGHYAMARAFGIGAETFSIGFGREVAGWTDRRGTRWKIGWLPLGGYVKFVGDADAASRPGAVPSAPDEAGRAFATRPVWQRFLVVLAGPLANLALAVLIFAAFFIALGAPQSSNVVGEVAPGSVAARAGIVAGDRIVSIDGRTTDDFTAIRGIVTMRPGMAVALVTERDGARAERTVRLDRVEERDDYGQPYAIGRLGVASTEMRYERMSPFAALPHAVVQVGTVMRAMVDGLGQIVAGERSAKELGGPVKMAQVAGQQMSLGPFTFVELVALFSINLGFINLLPVPMLDGGHLMLYTIEAVRRRPVSERVQDWAFRGGLALLLAVLMMTTVNDLGSVGLVDRLQRLIG